MSSLEIRLFGPPSVWIDGQPMPRLKTRKGMWLLALLVLRNGREVDRNWLAGTLWPDADEATALTYLRQVLTDLRKALGRESNRVESPTSRTLRLDLTDADCDVVRFDSQLARGIPEEIESVVGLYIGPLLEGCTEEWAFQERESRTQAWLGALETLAGNEIATGKPAVAVRRLKQVISVEPLRESAHSDLMRALAATGDVAAVMESYRDLRLLVRRELNAEPTPETRALFESIRSEARSRAEEAVGQAAVPIRPLEKGAPKAPDIRAPILCLPRFVSEFIGREREIAAVRRCLNASRLVTLTGVGGVGKTRLAVRVSEEEGGRFPAGTGFVDLTPLTEPMLVANAAAAALGLREHPSRSASDTIAGFVDTQPALLILDNCEHVLSSCAQLAGDLLKRCPNLRILATSRQRLRIAGETEWRVPPLEVPLQPIEDDASLEILLQSNEALALFIDRALGARPGLQVDIPTLRTATDICRRLDGIPLAIELAAARLHAMTVTQLAERLNERFKLLVTGDVTAPARQQTLRATLDWSHEMLTDEEGMLFRRLSIFAGGWSLEAAEEVCCWDANSDFSVLDGLASLVEKSLILFSDSGSDGRYRMLESVRQYSREKLARSGSEAELRRTHGDYFVALAEEAARYLSGPKQGEWLDRLDEEHDNLRTALDWCAAQPDGTRIGMRLAGALRRFWLLRTHFTEGSRRYAYFLGRDSIAAPTYERALVMHGSGSMSLRQGDYAAAREMFLPALAIFQQAGDHAKAAEVLTNLAYVYYSEGDYETAYSLFNDALEVNKSAGSQISALVALHGLGNLSLRAGDFAVSKGHFERCLVESRACGSREMEAAVLISLGQVLEAQGDSLRSIERLDEALSLLRELKDVTHELVCLTTLANTTRRLNNIPLANRYYREGLLLARDRPGNREERIVAYLLEGVASLAMTAGDATRAAWLLSASRALLNRKNITLPIEDRQETERSLAALRKALDSAEFESAWSEGESSRVDTAISVALETISPSL